ncbi:MAG: flagellar hook-basal body complex protein, partial [Alphaproteobacteria bacterium]|nr:flagellar hook-basal body complex protein [Alphaproteobacteria bacterium]
ADLTTNSIIFTFANNSAVVGKLAIKQTKTTPPNSTTISIVRPDSIGPLSISSDSNGHLLIEGSPTGEPFRLNLQTNGQVQPAEPQGASLTQPGRQIGQSMAASATSPLMYQGNNDLLGIGASKTASIISGTGLTSTAAIAYGGTAITPMNQTFVLNEGLGENKMTFTIDGITGSITLPIRAYTGDTLASAIQQRINQIQDPTTGRVVSGATVSFDPTNNRLKFTSGTTGSYSQFNVVGPANFGLNAVTQNPGKVPLITPLTQAVDQNKNPLYVDANGNITTVKPSTKSQSWAPLYLTPGELKFDTSGKLASPTQGVVYSPFNPGNGANPLNLTIDYGKYSTQYTQPFSVLSLQQDGYTSGQLDGLNIDANGTVRANYTNGQTKALGKIILANFANPNGLKQVGNSNYVANSVSGEAVLGQAGADGFGSIQSGALERSNVDITEELVTLITAQRNFQANSKAIETETTLTQTIIQIRG